MTLLELFLLGSTLIFLGTTIWALRMNNRHVAMYHELSGIHDRLIESIELGLEGEKHG